MNNDISLYTKIGIIYTNDFQFIIDLCKNKEKIHNLKVVDSHLKKLLYISKEFEENYINTNLLIVENINIKYFKNICINENLNYFIINNISLISDINFNMNDIIIIPLTILNKIKNNFMFRNYKFKRVIYHNINISNIDLINSQFYWLTSSNLNFFINNPLFKLSSYILDNITINNLDKLKKYEIEEIKCKTPIEVLTLDGLVEKVVINHLNAYDVKKALCYINSDNKKPENQIINSVLKSLHDKLNNIDIQKSSILAMKYVSEIDKETRINKLDNLKKITEDKKDDLLKRITKNEVCFICYEEIINKCILKCCKNNICFECINKWLNNNDKCPLCKVTPCNYYIVDNDSVKFDKRVIINSQNSKFENLEILVSKLLNENKKILIISCYSHPLRKISNIFCKLNLKFKLLQGNYKSLMKIIDNYNNNIYDILLYNSKKYNFGINLEKMTDLISFDNFDEEIINDFCRQSKSISNIWKLVF